MKDRKRRSIVKTVTWRVIATLMTMIAVYVITGDLSLSIGTGIILNFVKTIAYYIHERFWENIAWGRIQNR